jgi:hypothetical protein
LPGTPTFSISLASEGAGDDASWRGKAGGDGRAMKNWLDIGRGSCKRRESKYGNREGKRIMPKKETNSAFIRDPDCVSSVIHPVAKVYHLSN